MKFIRILALLAAFALPAAPAYANLADATAKAQGWQNTQCGRGWNWVCVNAYAPAAGCFWNRDYSPAFWDCYGSVHQRSFSLAERFCPVYSHIRDGQFIYRNNWCF